MRTTSVRLWSYEEEKCGNDFCPGDCNHCGKADHFGDAWFGAQVIKAYANKLRQEVFKEKGKDDERD